MPDPRYSSAGDVSFRVTRPSHRVRTTPTGIFVTVEDENSVRKRAALIPNSVYLHKPFTGTVLLAAVLSLLNRGSSCTVGERNRNGTQPGAICVFSSCRSSTGFAIRLRGVGLAHLGLRSSVLVRGVDFRGGWPSTSPPSPGPPLPSNACATFARSCRFFEADATLLGCPVMSELDASATSTHRPGDRASFEWIRERSKG